MKIQSFIEKAIEGGYKPRDIEGRHEKPVVRIEYLPHTEAVEFWFRYEFGGGELTRQALATMLLDPLAWQAVGKVEGKDKVHQTACYALQPAGLCDCHPDRWYEWAMHSMIDHIASGGTIESYLETL